MKIETKDDRGAALVVELDPHEGISTDYIDVTIVHYGNGDLIPNIYEGRAWVAAKDTELGPLMDCKVGAYGKKRTIRDILWYLNKEVNQGNTDLATSIFESIFQTLLQTRVIT